jgi:hypothetical protein
VRFSGNRLRLVRAGVAGTVVGVTACAGAPRAGPLTGTPVVRRLPATDLPSGHRRITFRWEYRERVFSGRGQGAARIAPPDSARMDFFLENGSSGGFVILIADSLHLETHDQVRRSMPPVPMLWAALGRVTVSAPDTVVLVDGDTLRAEIGRDPAWRLTFGRDALVRLERIEGGRIIQTVERTDSVRVEYRQPGTGRTLVLSILGRFRESAFDEAIWRR